MSVINSRIIIQGRIIVNLHEECLLKYLSNPLDIYATVELLKMSNKILIKESFTNNKNCNFANFKSNVCCN